MIDIILFIIAVITPAGILVVTQIWDVWELLGEFLCGSINEIFEFLEKVQPVKRK